MIYLFRHGYELHLVRIIYAVSLEEAQNKLDTPDWWDYVGTLPLDQLNVVFVQTSMRKLDVSERRPL